MEEGVEVKFKNVVFRLRLEEEQSLCCPNFSLGFSQPLWNPEREAN